MAYTRVIAKNEYRPFVTFLLHLHQLEKKELLSVPKDLDGRLQMRNFAILPAPKRKTSPIQITLVTGPHSKL
jgi:hypothetical protein